MILFYILLVLLIIVITILILLTILMFFIALKINFIFDTDKDKMNLTVLWLYPLIKAEVYMKDKKPMLKLFLMNIKIYEKAMKTEKNATERMTLVKDIKLDDINLTAYYGFQDKFTVGIVCGLINFASQFLKVESLNQNPDFMAINDYIYVDANATMKIVPALKKLAHH